VTRCRHAERSQLTIRQRKPKSRKQIILCSLVTFIVWLNKGYSAVFNSGNEVGNVTLYQSHATSPGRDEPKPKLPLNKSINQSAGNSVPLQMGIGLIHTMLFTHSSLSGTSMTSLLYANEIICHIDCSYPKTILYSRTTLAVPWDRTFASSEIISAS